MNCKDFNKNLIEYLELESSGVANHEMKQHMETCEGCCTLYKERLELKASFNKLFNNQSKNFTPQNNIILNKLENKYYAKSLTSKIAYHLKRNKFIYATGIAFATLVIFALPLMKNYENKPYIIGKVASNNRTITKPASLTNKNSITIRELTTAKFKGHLLEIYDPTKIEIGYSFQNLTADKTTSEIAKSYGAVAAINGGTTLIDAETKEIYAGIAIHEGKIVYSNLKDENLMQDVIGFKQNGLLVVGKHTLTQIKELGLKEGITLPFAIQLIDKGKATTLTSDMGINPRTAIGQKADGSVLMLVIDGRNANCIGATLSDVQKIFMEFGAVTAVNLDGGTHSTMYYNGELINKPCAPSGECAVPSTFMVMP